MTATAPLPPPRAASPLPLLGILSLCLLACMSVSVWLYSEQSRHARHAVAISAAATEGGRALRVLADTQLLHARAQIDQGAYETALRRVEGKTAHAVEALRPVDRIEDLETALQGLRTALADRQGLDSAGDTLRLALTDMRRRTETAAAAAAAHADGCRTAFYAIVLPTLAGALLAVGVALQMTRRREHVLADRARQSHATRRALARLAGAGTRGEVAEIVLEAAQELLPPGMEPRPPIAIGPDLRIDLPPGPAQPTAELLLASLADAAGLALERISLLARLAEAATTDPLTGLPNRRALLEAAPRMVAQARRDARPITTAMIDIDHFKRINDLFGHPEGDHVLREVALLIRSSLRAGDLVVRWGGEEFAAILVGCTPEQARDRLDRLRMATDAIDWAGAPASLSFSAGVAQIQEGEALEAALGRADAALYQAKAAGRDRVEIA